MEPRLLLDATPFVFAIGPDQPNVTVAVADVSGVATVQFTNNETDGVLASRALSDTSEIVVTGSDQDDVLTIDVGDDGALAAIPIAFD
ncbi:MAG TPA: LEPR-XLL domain-containing protein, partial [Terriglobia bacterium]|nr:LEPR-XLL domain-containing protein [Terriglobia bacterium]